MTSTSDISEFPIEGINISKMKEEIESLQHFLNHIIEENINENICDLEDGLDDESDESEDEMIRINTDWEFNTKNESKEEEDDDEEDDEEESRIFQDFKLRMSSHIKPKVGDELYTIYNNDDILGYTDNYDSLIMSLYIIIEEVCVGYFNNGLLFEMEAADSCIVFSVLKNGILTSNYVIDTVITVEVLDKFL